MSRIVAEGAGVSVTVPVTGSNIAFEWRRNGQVLAGATTSSLAIDRAGPGDEGWYLLTASNTAGKAYSVFHLQVAVRDTALVSWGSGGSPEVLRADSDVVDVAGWNSWLVLRADGRVLLCSANNLNYEPTTLVQSGAVAISAADDLNRMVLKGDGTVVRLGSAPGFFSPPDIPAGLDNVVAIAGGASHGLALRADGSVASWGTPDNPLMITHQPGTSVPAVAVAAGWGFSLVLLADGTMITRGSWSGGPSAFPWPAVAQIAGRNGQILAWSLDGTLTGWTQASGATNRPARIPDVARLLPPMAALKTDGSLVTWDSLSAPLPTCSGVFRAHALGARRGAAMTFRTPVIFEAPAGRKAVVGASTQFDVVAYASGDVVYRWTRDGQELTDGTGIAGAASPRLQLTNLQQAQTGDYVLKITGSNGSISTPPARLDVGIPPTISSPPTALRIDIGGTASFTVAASGPGPLSYQWLKGNSPLADGGSVSGATTATLTLTGVHAIDAGLYSVKVSNAAADITSAAAALQVTTVPYFTVRPRSRRAALGSAEQFVAPATGPGPIHYEWRRNGKPIAGATGAALTLPAVTRGDRGIYVVAATNSHGTSRSVFHLHLAPSVASPLTVAAWTSSESLSPFGDRGDFVALDMGWTHGVAMRGDGTIQVWDRNAGVGAPPLFPTVDDIVAVSAARASTAVLRADGSVLTAGFFASPVPESFGFLVGVAAGTRNTVGIRPDGTAVDTVYTVPAGLTDVIAVDAAARRSMALTGAGQVHEWGDGLAWTTPALTDVVAIAAGESHSLALKRDGTVVGWPSGVAAGVVPSGLTDVIEISAGYDFSLAVKADGKVITWGDGTPALPVPSALRGAVAGAIGLDGAMALVVPTRPVIEQQPRALVANAGDTVTFSIAFGGFPVPTVTWTKNGEPIPGALVAVTSSGSTLTLSGLGDAAAGLYQATLRNAAGTVTSASVGLTVLHPPQLARPMFGRDVREGQTWTAQVSASGAAPLRYRWWKNGELIAGATAAQVQMPAAGLSDRGWYEVEVQDADGLVTRSRFPVVVVPRDGRVLQWSWKAIEGLAARIEATEVTAIAAGSGHLLYLRGNGAVSGVGSDSRGQLTIPSDLGPVRKIGAAAEISFAVTENGRARVWGDPRYGALAVPGDLQGVVELASSGTYCVALLDNGSLVAWGSAAIGGPAYVVPAGLPTIEAISAAFGRVYALRADGVVVDLAAPAVELARQAVRLRGGLALRADGTILDVSALVDGRPTAVLPGTRDHLAPARGGNARFAITAQGRVKADVSESIAGPGGTKVLEWLEDAVDVAGTPSVTSPIEYALVAASPPVLIEGPAGMTVPEGSTVTFGAKHGGAGPFQYLWTYNGLDGVPKDIASRELDPVLRLNAVSSSDEGLFAVRITNLFGSIRTPAARLTVLPGSTAGVGWPVQRTTAGKPLELTASSPAAGATWQWRLDGNDIPGATRATFALAAATRGDAGYYELAETRDGRTVVHSGQEVRVQPKAYPGVVELDRSINLAAEIVDGWVMTAKAAPGGGFFVGGTFSSIQGQPRSLVARFLADGTLDPNFKPIGLRGTAYAIQPTADGKLWVAGDIPNVQAAGKTYAHLLRLNADGSVDTALPDSVRPSGVVRALALQSTGTIVVGGLFSGWPYRSDLPTGYLARFSPDGAKVDTAQLGDIGVTGGGVLALAVDSQDRILLGGYFTLSGATPRLNLARLTAAGGFDASFNPNPGPDNAVSAVAVAADDSILFGGYFSSYYKRKAVGLERIVSPGLGRLAADGTFDEAFAANLGTGLAQVPYDLAAEPAGTWLIGGPITSFNNESSGPLLRLRADGTRATQALAQPNNTVAAIRPLPDGTVVLGGYFTRINGSIRQRLARVNAEAVLQASPNVLVMVPGKVNALTALPGGKILVGGRFDALCGRLGAQNVGRLNSDLSLDPSFNATGAGANAEVQQIVSIGDGRAWLTGAFTTYNGITRSWVVRLKADGTADETFDLTAGAKGPPQFLVNLPQSRALVGLDGSTGTEPFLRRVLATGLLDSAFDAGPNTVPYAALRAPDGRIWLTSASALSIHGRPPAWLVRVGENGAFDKSLGASGESGFQRIALHPFGGVMLHVGAGMIRVSRDLEVDPGFSVAGQFVSSPPFLLQEDGRLIARSGRGSLPGFAAVGVMERLRADGNRDDSFRITGFTASPGPILMLDSGQLLVASDDGPGLSVTRGVSPVFAAGASPYSVASGGTATLTADFSGAGPYTYQWFRNGVAVAGGTSAALTVAAARATDAGEYTLVLYGPTGTHASPPIRLRVTPPQGGIMAVDARDAGGPGGLQGSFSVAGSVPKVFLIRALGPALTASGVAGAAANPRIRVVALDSGSEVAANDDWSEAPNAAELAVTAARLGALPLAAGSRDAALLASFEPGSYRVSVGPDEGAGVALLQIYEADTLPRLAYAATHGRVGPGAPLVQALALRAPNPGRTYLVRALGPSLGHTDAVPNPKLAIFAGETRLAENDDWAGEARLVSLAAQGGAQPIPADSRDAVVAFVPGAAGVASIQVSSEVPGLALIEVFEIENGQMPETLPVVISPPVSVTVAAGLPASFGVVTVGSPAPRFLWSKDSAALPGGTGPTFRLGAAQVADAGLYSVRLADTTGGYGPAWSARLTVTSRDNSAHAVIGPGYLPGHSVTISAVLHLAAAATDVSWTAQLPAGWTLASDDVVAATARPPTGSAGPLVWRWAQLPAGAHRFAFRLAVPAGEAGPRTLGASFQHAALAATAVIPAALIINRAPLIHSADTSQDGRIDLIELLRMVQLFNARTGAVRTGAYRTEIAGEDGFAPDLAPPGTPSLVTYHTADTNRDGRIGLVELTRVIELYNVREGTQRVGRYRIYPGSEDGFAPDP